MKLHMGDGVNEPILSFDWGYCIVLPSFALTAVRDPTDTFPI